MRLDTRVVLSVEHGMAYGRLCILSKEASAPYERPTLTEAYSFTLDKKPPRLAGFHTCVVPGGERQTDWYKEKGIEMFYEGLVTNVDIEKQTFTTNSGKLLKYGSIIAATGSTASKFSEKFGGNLTGVNYIRDDAVADSPVPSLVNSCSFLFLITFLLGMKVAAAAVGWKLNIKIIFPDNYLLQRLFTPSLASRYDELYQENGVKFLQGVSIKNLEKLVLMDL
ncbi:hypothetical protein I3843_11G127100 [Carya illinoinensis]|uniref:FAD/NAD(P)-binding domain-containing protein n=1 Tax=Carya illinoinensis TaxID=32201 RepID=A0A922DPY5_CARIL|nr:hypothetical protein I3842_11G128900 [Carya illinoinensis]KAG7956504.1 hypothetical protein I3843_11G127100 [Carya illinoinensis]